MCESNFHDEADGMVKDWERLDKDRGPTVGIYIQTEPNWIGKYHCHPDKIQWIMPLAGEYGVVDSGIPEGFKGGDSNPPMSVAAKCANVIPVHSVLMIPPGTMHLHVTHRNPVVVLVSMVRSVWDDLLCRWAGEGGDTSRITGLNTVVSNELHTLMARIHEAASQVHVPGTSMLLDSLTAQLAVVWLQKTGLQTGLQFSAIRHQEAIERLCLKLSQDPGYPWTIEAMAYETALSPSQFVRSFKDLMNTTPYRHLSNLRLQHAVRRLSNSSKSIDVIAEESGFGSRRSLEVALKTHYGISPAEWRKRAAQKPG